MALAPASTPQASGTTVHRTQATTKSSFTRTVSSRLTRSATKRALQFSAPVSPESTPPTEHSSHDSPCNSSYSILTSGRTEPSPPLPPVGALRQDFSHQTGLERRNPASRKRLRSAQTLAEPTTLGSSAIKTSRRAKMPRAKNILSNPPEASNASKTADLEHQLSRRHKKNSPSCSPTIHSPTTRLSADTSSPLESKSSNRITESRRTRESSKDKSKSLKHESLDFATLPSRTGRLKRGDGRNRDRAQIDLQNMEDPGTVSRQSCTSHERSVARPFNPKPVSHSSPGEHPRNDSDSMCEAPVDNNNNDGVDIDYDENDDEDYAVDEEDEEMGEDHDISNDHADEEDQDDDDSQDNDPFRSGLFGSDSQARATLAETLRHLTGYMSGTSERLKNLLKDLRNEDEPMTQLMALQEFSELLLVHNGDNLVGQFAPERFVTELVKLMQPEESAIEDRTEIMLMACRCLANMMEVLPSSVSAVVYSGAVPVLCEKLTDIQFIDLAEQVLITLEKISREFPAAVVRAGGLSACLQYVDFFATATQRTAVTTAANSCRKIPFDAFPAVQQVMGSVQNVLSSSDQRVVEQAALCVFRISESFQYAPTKLEELISIDLLQAIRRLLLPSSSKIIGPEIFTSLLRVLSTTAVVSSRLAAQLLRTGIVDSLKQILTGTSTFLTGDHEAKSSEDSSLILQSLMHRPKEHIIQVLHVICSLLPNLESETSPDSPSTNRACIVTTILRTDPTRRRSATANSEYKAALQPMHAELYHFASTFMPILSHVYSSTVDLGVRQKVMIIVLKMLDSLDINALQSSLAYTNFGSFLVYILSKKDHPSLTCAALKAVELALERFDSSYLPQLYREGVMAEVQRLAVSSPKVSLTTSADQNGAAKVKERNLHKKHPERSAELVRHVDLQAGQTAPSSDSNSDEDEHTEHSMSLENADLDSLEDSVSDDQASQNALESGKASAHMRSQPIAILSRPRSDQIPKLDDINIEYARTLMQKLQDPSMIGLERQATNMLESMRDRVQALKSLYGNKASSEGFDCLTTVSNYFQHGQPNTATSSELLGSGLIDALLEILNHSDKHVSISARADFLAAFLKATSSQESGDYGSRFQLLLCNLQELLCRAENFEIVMANDAGYASGPSTVFKEIKLRLACENDSAIDDEYQDRTISIHAIASFEALDLYLQMHMLRGRKGPRLCSLRDLEKKLLSCASETVSTRPQSSRRADSMARQIHPAKPEASRSVPGQPIQSTSWEDNDESEDDLDADTSDAMDTQNDSNPLRESKGKMKLATDDDSATSAASGRSVSDELVAESNAHEDIKYSSKESDSEQSPAPRGDVTDERLGIVGENMLHELDQRLGEDSTAEPPAVNMRISPPGESNALTDSGARISTPKSSKSRPNKEAESPNPEFASQSSKSYAERRTSDTHPKSYAAAIKAAPKDWHIRYSVNNRLVPADATIFQAVAKDFKAHAASSSRSLWTDTHLVKFHCVMGPAPSGPIDSYQEVNITTSDALATCLESNILTSKILRLLKMLYEMSTNMDQVISDNDPTALNPITEPLPQFINTKLTAKMKRQLEEPVIVVSKCLPRWSTCLARQFSFLFPFETRLSYLQATSFGHARTVQRLLSASASGLPDHIRNHQTILESLARQKVRISRPRMLESACKVMQLYGAKPSQLEIEYFDEMGTGLGPTLEFYATVSKEFSRTRLGIWRANDIDEGAQYAVGRRGLFPAPLNPVKADSDGNKKTLYLFHTLGKFIARSMLDSRLIDISLNVMFLRIASLPPGSLRSLQTLAKVDERLASSLRVLQQFDRMKSQIRQDASLNAAQIEEQTHQITVDGFSIDDLGLDFTLPGYPKIELVPNGANTAVTIDDIEVYIDAVVDMTVGRGIQLQVEAFKQGFSEVFPYSSLSAFTAQELVMIFGQGEEDWSFETLHDSIKADHGFNIDSKGVTNFLQVISEFDLKQRRKFLQFVTGSPKLPIGGFKSLNPILTVVRKPAEAPFTSDDFLVSVMTCANYIKLPEYSSIDVLRDRLKTAITEGQGAFLLS